MLYGYVTDNIFPLLVTYAIGDVLSIIFIGIYLRWSPDRRFILKAIAFTFICNGVITIYTVLGKHQATHQSVDGVNQTVGFIAIASSILLYTSPFSTIAHVVKTKSSSSIPITMVMIGVVNNALWIIYGGLISDLILIIPTSISVTLGLIQVLLFVIFHPKWHSTYVTSSTPSTKHYKHISAPFSAIITPAEAPTASNVTLPTAINAVSNVPLDSKVEVQTTMGENSNAQAQMPE